MLPPSSSQTTDMLPTSLCMRRFLPASSPNKGLPQLTQLQKSQLHFATTAGHLIVLLEAQLWIFCANGPARKTPSRPHDLRFCKLRGAAIHSAQTVRAKQHLTRLTETTQHRARFGNCFQNEPCTSSIAPPSEQARVTAGPATNFCSAIIAINSLSQTNICDRRRTHVSGIVAFPHNRHLRASSNIHCNHF